MSSTLATKESSSSKTRKCVYCNGDLKNFLHKSTDSLKEEMLTERLRKKLPHISSKKCKKCGSIIATDSRVESSKNLIEIYQELPDSYWDNLSFNYERNFFDLLEKELNPHGNSLNICDVGCGDGQFLKQFSSNWNKFAVEPGNQDEGKFKQDNIELFRGTLGESDFKYSSMDVISYIDVIEHLTDPKKEIETAKKFLKPGGRIVIYTGNADSITAKLAGQHWGYLKCIGHISVASKDAIVNLLTSLNFSNFKTISHSHPSSVGLFTWSTYCMGSKLLGKGTVPLFKDHILITATLTQ